MNKEFERIREEARGLAPPGPELVHPGLKPKWDGNSLSAEDLRDEYFKLAEDLTDKGLDRPHRRARDCLIVRNGDMEHNLGSLLDECFEGSELAKDSVPKKERISFEETIMEIDEVDDDC